MERTILVGLDHSEPADAALEWAAREACVRHTGLLLVHAFPWPLVGVPLDPRQTDAWEGAQTMLAEARRKAGEWISVEEVRTEVVTESPSAALIERSAEAELAVLGMRGHGGFHELIVGSVALQVAGHASCPVVLTHAGWRPPVDAREIVVGVGADAPLAVAFAEAELRGVRLRAIRAWQTLPPWGTGGVTPMVSPVPEVERYVREHLTRTLAPWRDKYPDVRVTESLVCETPRRALADAAAKAELLVIGARDRSGKHGPALGSTAHGVMHHAPCPVLVAHQS